MSMSVTTGDVPKNLYADVGRTFVSVQTARLGDVDALSSFLGTVRTVGGRFASVDSAEDHLDLEPSRSLTMITVVEGSAEVSADDAEPLLAPRRAVALARAGRRIRVRPGQDDSTTSVLVSRLSLHRHRSSHVLDTLPDVTVVPDEGLPCPILDVVLAEWEHDQPGGQLVLERASEVLLLITLREWYTQWAPEPPAWFVAAGDPVLAPVLRAIHAEPRLPWTVASLAARVPTSRATLAARFRAVLGETPIAYLSRWRMHVAADLLAETDLPVVDVARAVGYTSPFAFSEAFTRAFGVRPSTARGERSDQDEATSA